RAGSPRAVNPIACRVGLLLVAVASPACGDSNTAADLASIYAQHCAQPRSKPDPVTGQPSPDVAGSVMDEKLWVHWWIDDLYLWYREAPNADIATFATAVDYFDQQKTPATTPSGKPKDQFHFIYDTSVWEAMSQGGTEASYGIQWALLQASPPRSLTIAYVEP